MKSWKVEEMRREERKREKSARTGSLSSRILRVLKLTGPSQTTGDIEGRNLSTTTFGIHNVDLGGKNDDRTAR